jgi:O-antigen/teichoic acid export membrane protein
MTKTVNSRMWIARGGWALVDQAFFALANVLLNVLLARWLTPAQFGAFAVAYSLFLFFGAIHTALLTEPMLVFGANRYAQQTGAYLQALLKGHWSITIAGSVLIALTALVLRIFNQLDLSQALFGLALATPFSLLTWFGRRAVYLLSTPRTAALASFCYFVLVVLGLITLVQFNSLSLFSAFTVVGIAGAFVGLFMVLRLRKLSPKVDQVTSVAKTHWNYGRWAVANALLMWVPLNFFFVVLSIAVSFESSATLKALSNLVLPLLQVNAALATLLLPALTSRANHSEQFNHLVSRALAFFTAMAIAYAGFLAMFGNSLVHSLYGGKYDSAIGLLWLLLLIPIIDGITVVFASATRAQERPDRIFWSQLAVTAFVLPVGVVSARSFGLIGAAATIVLGNFLGLVILVLSQYSTSVFSAWRKPKVISSLWNLCVSATPWFSLVPSSPQRHRDTEVPQRRGPSSNNLDQETLSATN